MLHSTCLLLLSALAAPPVAPPPLAPNVVEVCSLALGTCSSLAATALDPTLRPAAGGGQLAFVDAETGSLVSPSREQAAELAATLALHEEQKAAAEPVMETLPDGTVRVRGDFTLQLRATIVEPTATEPAAVPAPAAAPSAPGSVP